MLRQVATGLPILLVSGKWIASVWSVSSLGSACTPLILGVSLSFWGVTVTRLMPDVERTLRVLATGGGWKYPQPSEVIQAKLDTLVRLGLAHFEDREDGRFVVAGGDDAHEQRMVGG